MMLLLKKILRFIERKIVYVGKRGAYILVKLKIKNRNLARTIRNKQ